MHTKDELVEKITPFLNEIGIPTQFTSLSEDTFLPGLKIDKGELLIDMDRLKYPGDMLHEAGHIAVLSPSQRSLFAGNLQDFQSDAESYELGAILWSYAALKHLDIDPKIVFHAEGYKGDADWLTDNFENGTYIGLPLLVWMQMTETDTFPKMDRWMRQTE